MGFPVFTEEPNKLGWNNRIVVQENEQDVDEFEDYIVGKSFDVFESKLQKGFLEAPNLGLVSAPPAIFDYQPPLQVTIYFFLIAFLFVNRAPSSCFIMSLLMC